MNFKINLQLKLALKQNLLLQGTFKFQNSKFKKAKIVHWILCQNPECHLLFEWTLNALVNANLQLKLIGKASNRFRQILRVDYR